jgi:phospholipase/carboxylesterase
LHGFGAPGEDLVSLARVLAAPKDTRFVFPAAPIALDLMPGMESRAWWMIDMERMQRAMERGEMRDLTSEVPEGLADARTKVDAFLDEVTRSMNPKWIALGGFSQGAMLSTDVALRSDRKLAGLVLMSGTLLAEREWLPLMPKRKGMRVYQSHGTHDPILPFAIAERLRDEMIKTGLDVKFTQFRGAHEIPGPVVDGVGKFLESLT